MSQKASRSGKAPDSKSKAVAPPSPPDSQMSEDDARRIDTAEDELNRIVKQAQEEAGVVSDTSSKRQSAKAKKPAAKPRANVAADDDDDEIEIAVAPSTDKKTVKADEPAAVEETAAKEQDMAEDKAEVDAEDDDQAEATQVEEAVKEKKSKKKRASSQGDSSAERSKRKRQSNDSAGAPTSTSKKAKRDKSASGLKVNKKSKSTIEVMTKVPSLKRVRTFRGFPSFRASLDDNTITEFKKDQAVFVLPDPETLDEPNNNPRQDEYWLALVKDIRANSTVDPVTNEWTADPSEVFVVVEWFYKVHDLPGANIQRKIADTIEACEKYFGWKEVVRSDHEAVISVFSCCEPVPIYHFQDNAGPEEPAVKLIDERHRLENDGDDEPEASIDPEENPNHLHASQANYFYRLSLPKTQPPEGTAAGAAPKKKSPKAMLAEFESLNLHCLCQKPYSPANDKMRYCLDCSKWFHEACLSKHEWTGDIPELDAPNGKPPTDLYHLAMLPIIRGGHWGIGGNINIVSKAKEIVRNGEYDNYDTALTLAGWDEWKDWIKYLDSQRDKADDDVEALLQKGFKCPECASRI